MTDGSHPGQVPNGDRMAGFVSEKRAEDAETRALAESQAAVCGMFGNPKRILILWTLADRERSVSQISSTVGTSLQSMSQHLRLMRESGVLDSRREGRTIYYFIANDETGRACRHLLRVQSAVNGEDDIV
jgi:DNA-binding transcriptional ArsR family regulator